MTEAELGPHGHARDDRAEPAHAEQWVKEHTSGERNPERVIDEGEEQILPDVPHHRAAKVDGFRNRAQSPHDESDAGAFATSVPVPIAIRRAAAASAARR